MQKNLSIVIKPADKGDNIVILDKLQYINMFEKILENSEWYESVKPDRLEQAHSILIDLITEANQPQGLADSFHPQPLIKSIPYSQYSRLRRNCSSEDHFSTEAVALRDRLLLRGYRNKILKMAYNKAKLLD